jgi:hypothetical protein
MLVGGGDTSEGLKHVQIPRRPETGRARTTGRKRRASVEMTTSGRGTGTACLCPYPDERRGQKQRQMRTQGQKLRARRAVPLQEKNTKANVRRIVISNRKSEILETRVSH